MSVPLSSPVIRGTSTRAKATICFCRNFFLAAVGLVVPLQAQNFNPNGFDAVKTMGAILHPYSDLILVSSHRGVHALVDGSHPLVPENSLQAIGLSAQEGDEEIELDVKLTSDGIPILSHDQNWGREWCGLSSYFNPIYAQVNFDPLTPPGTPNNDEANPTVSSVSLANTRSLFGHTYLRDSISAALRGGQDPNNRGCAAGIYYGVYPPTLEDALNYMTENKIAMVLALDIRDPHTANVAWQVIGNHNDYLGRNYLNTTLFKLPAKAFASPSAVETALPSGPGQYPAYFQPVYNTSDIEATTATTSTNLQDFGGTDVDPSTTGYGSESAIIASLQAFENDPNIDVAAVEIQIHQSNGILSSVLSAAKTNSRTGKPESVTVFSPYVDYWASDDPNHMTPLFFRTDAYCCIPLSNFFFNAKMIPDPSAPISSTLGGQPEQVNNPNYDSSRPSDTADERSSLPFLVGQGFNGITYDNPAVYVANLNESHLHNLDHITGTPPAGRTTFSVCDIYSAGGTPCVAAHSTVRALSSTYNGPLYQVRRASDETTTDINVVPSTGYANAAAQDSFCTGTTCIVTIIYDQTFYGNDLTIEGPGGNVKTADSGALATALPITLKGTKVYGVSVTSGVGYRNNATKGIARNVANNNIAAPEGTYMVTSGTNVSSGCCFDYGNAETSGDDTGNGHMDALNFGTFCEYTCSGSGPWVEADLENGQYQGNGANPGDQSISSNFVTAMLKNNTQTAFSLKAGNAQSGGLTTEYSGPLPTVKSGYSPMSLEGAIVLGTGGDNSDKGIGSFFEGAMTAGTPSDATDDAVQANIVAAGYGGSSNPTNGEAGNYTGPSDPNGPGPQDGFVPPAAEQANDFMGSKPAMAFFEGRDYVAFQANNSSHNLFVTSTTSGTPYPAATGYPNIQIGSAPAMTEFRHQLYVAFQADNSSHNLFVTSSPTGTNFPNATGHPNIQIGSAPAMVEFRHQLLVAFQGNESGHHLFTTASSDGQTFPTATQIPNVQIGSAPAMAVFNGKVYVAFRANDSTNALFVTSSPDGVNFTSHPLPGQFMGPNSSPALVVSNGILYCIYGANDLGNEMLVTASTDGSTWQGPRAYTAINMGDTGPAAAAVGAGITVGFQSNDSRSVLFTTYKTTEALTYTGSAVTGGLFASPASVQGNIAMGSKPALLEYNGNTYAAFQANNSSDNLFITSSPVGSAFPAAMGYTGIQMGSAPAMAAFNNKLYLAFQADNSSDNLFVSSSSDGANFPSATGQPNIHMGSAPAITVFNPGSSNKLFIAFQADNPSHNLFVTSSTDGTTWPDATYVPNVQIGSAPSMAVFKDKLYIAFRANDATNALFITSSSDGVHFTSQPLSGQFMNWKSSPALVVFNNALYCIYEADDFAGEMLVTESADGSNWQGPGLYPSLSVGPAGPAATEIATSPNGATENRIVTGFQSNDARNALYVTDSLLADPNTTPY